MSIINKGSAIATTGQGGSGRIKSERNFLKLLHTLNV